MEWKASIEKINNIKQIVYGYGNYNGTLICDLSTEPEDPIAYVKEFLGEDGVKTAEEEGKKEVQPIDMEAMFNNLANKFGE